MPKLENWKLINRKDLYGNPYSFLLGNVYGHIKANHKTGELCDGNNIITSKLIDIDLDNNTATTISGTVYNLGTKSDVESL